MAEPVLSVEDVALSAGGRRVAEAVSFALRAGELVALLGPNGAGKTTLLRACMGLAAPEAGTIRLGGEDPARMTPAERALRAAYLPQSRPAAWPMRARDVIALGRFAHGAAPHRLAPPDRAAVDAAVAACGLEALQHRPVQQLSGGEQARVHLARALAAGAPLLLADEPAAALDPLHQTRIMTLFRAAADRGDAALVVMHDPTLAARHADRLIWMANGKILADGPPRDTLTPAMMAEAYGLRAEIAPHPLGPVAIPLGPVEAPR